MNTRPALVAPALAVALGGMLLGSVGSASALAFDPDLLATGSLDVVDADYFVAGNAEYGATLTLRAGGADTQQSLSEASGPPFTTVTEVLTDFGDGFGFVVDGSADGVSGDDSLLPVEFSLALENASSTQRLFVSLEIDLTRNQVSTNTSDAGLQGGTDGDFEAFSESTLILEDGTQLFVSSVLSDSFFNDVLITTPNSSANELGPPPTYGAKVSDSRTETLALQIDPGMTVLLSGLYDLYWGSFAPNATTETTSSHQSFVSIVGVASEAIPAPATLLLAALGLAAAGVVRHRNSRVTTDPEASR